MDVKYVNPFVESVQEIFSIMLDAEAKRKDVGVAKGGLNVEGVAALIGVSGPVRGAVALHLSSETAVGVVNRLLGT